MGGIILKFNCDFPSFINFVILLLVFQNQDKVYPCFFKTKAKFTHAPFRGVNSVNSLKKILISPWICSYV
jgi:hypothetical protein